MGVCLNDMKGWRDIAWWYLFKMVVVAFICIHQGSIYTFCLNHNMLFQVTLQCNIFSFPYFLISMNFTDTSFCVFFSFDAHWVYTRSGCAAASQQIVEVCLQSHVAYRFYCESWMCYFSGSNNIICSVISVIVKCVWCKWVLFCSSGELLHLKGFTKYCRDC